MNPDQLGTRLPTLAGEGLQLRWLTEADLPSLQAIFADPQVVRYMATEPLGTRAAAEQYLQSIREGFLEGSLYQWGIELEGEIIGTCTLAAIDRQNRHAQIGFALKRDCWGRGLILKAVPAVIEFAFKRLQSHRIGADADPRNVASIRVLEKLGFQREGLLRECYFHMGEIQDALLFGLLQRDWFAAAGHRNDGSQSVKPVD
ncbi:Protein N-acetyltransferase, RimJ/RimL family [Microbulbifer donghaiensis]|uniref:Protein N-acetyltransferase, RimJ/RimL family n=1 Tax=Microbulbifer donghaiensis TaxID=494016 RepID=A0A1M5E852_9GAMM|nr:GNAT family N-acetyltransferase [Microbulbifer donghaiensis]SHF75397.1 Protein N-acetyltransferase, RimJ/RimL family [Microbulbifer donghaiensis]